MQMFVIGPQSYTMVNAVRTAEDKAEIKKLFREIDVDLFIHGSYVDSPWSYARGAPRARTSSSKLLGLPVVKHPGLPALHNIKRELKIAHEIGAKGVVIHIPKDPLETIIELIPKLIEGKPADVLLILETASYCEELTSSGHGAKLEDLMKYIVKAKLSNHVGVCIDTAHVWSKGIDISSFKAASEWLRGLKYPQTIKLIHLNDNRNVRGSCFDRHEPITRGKIWKNMTDKNSGGLMAFVAFSHLMSVPMILERKPVKKNGRKMNVIADEILLLKKIEDNLVKFVKKRKL